jgi:hypothetical protein
MNNILAKLLGGDLRSIGRADEVLADILKDSSLFEEVLTGMQSDNPLVRMRAADAIEKASKLHPEYLQPYKETVIYKLSEIEQQEVRWHVALLFSYLELNDMEKSLVAEKLLTWIRKSKSKIVIVNSLEALVHIVQQDKRYKRTVGELLKELITSGSPAVIARSKKLMNSLK